MSADPVVPAVRKPYEEPALRKLTEEQARMLLLGEASAGNEDAKELLELFYPEIANPH